MKIIFNIVIYLLISLTSFGQITKINKIDFNEITIKYCKTVTSKSEISRNPFVSIDKNSIIEIVDSVLTKEFPLYNFFSLTIIDDTAFEYNLARINIVVAKEKLKTKNTRILFPFDFTDKNQEFLKIFVEKSYKTDKKKIANSISKLFLKVQHFNELCCEKTISDITFQNCFSDNSTLNNVINFNLNCCIEWLPKPGEEKKKQENFRNTIYKFDKNKLKKIDINGWKNWNKIKFCLE